MLQHSVNTKFCYYTIVLLPEKKKTKSDEFRLDAHIPRFVRRQFATFLCVLGTKIVWLSTKYGYILPNRFISIGYTHCFQ